MKLQYLKQIAESLKPDTIHLCLWFLYNVLLLRQQEVNPGKGNTSCKFWKNAIYRARPGPEGGGSPIRFPLPNFYSCQSELISQHHGYWSGLNWERSLLSETLMSSSPVSWHRLDYRLVINAGKWWSDCF